MAKFKMFLIIMLVLITSSAFAFDKWDKTDYSLAAAALTLSTVDWMQTRNIANHPNEFYELNPIIGKHPSTEKVNTYFISMIIVGAGIAYALPSRWRKVWLGSCTALELGVTAHNFDIGIGLRF